MLTSLIIPTLNRPDDLARCLGSVERLTPGFDEILIVDQGEAGVTERLVENFTHPNVRVLRHPVRSLTEARNLGIARARGDLLFFVDDDTVLPPDYVAAALAGFTAHPEAVGLTGPVAAPGAPPTAGAARRGLSRMFYAALFVSSVHRNRVLRSGSNSEAWGAATHAPHEVQWFQGCHCAFRRRVFDDGLRFPEDFIRWGFGEDVVLSFRAYRRFGPGSLRFAPGFRLTHHSSPEVSLTPDAVVRMMVVYRFLFWYREVYRGSWRNLACYLLGQPGFLLFHPLRSLRAPGRRHILAVAWSAYRYLLRHGRDAADNRTDYNHFILHGIPHPCTGERR